MTKIKWELEGIPAIAVEVPRSTSGIPIVRQQRSLYATVVCGRYVTALVTCVSLLQLPLPMLHSHESYESWVHLAEHVDIRHTDTLPHGDELHWHFVSPRELNQEQRSEEDTHPSESGVVCLVVAGCSFPGIERLGLLSHERLAVASGELSADPRFSADIAFEPAQSFYSLRPAVRVCALFCVVRC